MATIKKMKKAQNGKELQPMGDVTKVSANKSKYVSEDGNYKMKFKGGDDNSAPTSFVQRRTLKGFLKQSTKPEYNSISKPGSKSMTTYCGSSAKTPAASRRSAHTHSRLS